MSTPLKNNSIKIFIAIIFHQFFAVIIGDKTNTHTYIYIYIWLNVPHHYWHSHSQISKQASEVLPSLRRM